MIIPSGEMTVVKKVLLMLFGVAVVSGVVLDSNQYFDRILSNFGREVTFYGLGLNFTRIQNFTQKLVNNLCECKRIFRVIPSCQSAFAEKLDNDTVLCAYFQKPIYQLPTIRTEKGKTFAFYKEPGQVTSSNYNTKWTSLQSNGIFFIYESTQLNSASYLLCRRNPNGYVLRLKTTEDLNIFWTVISVFPGIGVSVVYDFAIDLFFGSNKQPTWIDGTTFNETVAAGFTPNYSSSPPIMYIRVGVKPQIFLMNGLSTQVIVLCQVNPFQH